MSKRLSLPVGSKFGRWTIASSPIIKNNRSFYPCICDCGKQRHVFGSSLMNGSSQSCGCIAIERAKIACTKHGKEPRRLYTVWQSMLDRCYNKNKETYLRYGGRGICVCDQWRTNYIAFREWAFTNGYKEGLSLDRIDNNGNYEPTNCRWANDIQQANNKRNNTTLEAMGEIKTIAEWSRDPRCKVSARMLRQRFVMLRWPPHKAITHPPRHCK